MANNVGSSTGIVGIPNPTRRFTQWNITEVYGAGTAETNRYIVNVDDLVIDYATMMQYRVVKVTKEGIPTLEPISFTGISESSRSVSVIGSGPGLCSEGYRIYVNSKLIPSPFNIDNRVMFLGSDNSYIKIFKGTNISDRGNVISGIFNSVNRMTSENVPLEPVNIPHRNNTTYKTATQGFITDGVSDGEELTCVVYNNAGQITSRFKLLVVNTEFIRNIDASKKHIIDISLITPYLNSNDKGQIDFPIGMVAQSSSFIGKVTYSDGTSESYPVDGTKFSLFGFNTFVSSRIGDNVPLILNYRLAETEFANNLQIVDNHRFLNKKYTIKTVDSDNRYNVRLFVIPKWDSVALSYSLTYLLYSLERQAPIDVTRLVEYSNNSQTFNGKAFGVAQNLTVALNLDAVSQNYQYYRHVETFSITLLRPITDEVATSVYSLTYGTDNVIANDTVCRYSGGNNNYTLEVGNHFPTLGVLLSKWYENSLPLVFPYNEDIAPRPTHARLVIGTWSKEVPIQDLLSPITNVNAPIRNGATLEIEFLKISTSARLYLSRIGLFCIAV